MRKIGTVPERAQGEVLGAYLYSQGIESQVDESGDGLWVVWISSDDDIATATAILADFLADPESAQFTAGADHAKHKLQQEDAKDKRFHRNYYDRKRLFKRFSFGLVTAFLIALSIITTLVTNFGADNSMTDELFLTSVEYRDSWIVYDRTLPEVRSGQVWRLVTPIFLHLGFVHLLFNMLWMSDLGNMMERRHGSLRLLAFVCLLAIPSNVLQFLFTGPTFGGMSGVVYGLLGYLWIRSKTDPFYEIHLRRNTITMMGIWFVLCIVMPELHVANFAHAAGVVVGMAAGYITGLLARHKRYGA